MMRKLFSWISKNKVAFIIIIFIIVAIIIFPAIILSTSFIGIINPNDSQTVLSYFGSIIGGALTLLGVWWTIQDLNNERKVLNDNLNMPIIELEVKYKHIWSSKIKYGKDEIDTLNIHIDFIVRNIGNIAAINLNITPNIEITPPGGGTNGGCEVNVLYKNQFIIQNVYFSTHDTHSKLSIDCFYISNDNKRKEYKVTYTYSIIPNKDKSYNLYLSEIKRN